MNYELVKGFLQKSTLESYIQDIKRLISTYYTTEFLQSHAAYFSDKSENRESYAFAVMPGNRRIELPALSATQIQAVSKRLSTLNLKASEVLGVSPDSRLMLNVQIYRGNSKPVTRHFDGEYFDFSVQEDGSLNVVRGLRPERVAVCVLHNDSTGGTRIHDKSGDSSVVVGEGGDLLIINNIDCLHSVDELRGESTRQDGILRMTVGWRSLEENVWEIRDGQTTKKIDAALARDMHRRFLSSDWPGIYADYVHNAKDSAF